MTTQQLQCFLRVAERLNFTKAAEELYLSVPTVTHHIQNLETELGTQLLIRTSRKVQLTPAGVSFYQDASEIYGKILVAAKRIHNLDRKGIQVLRIGCVTNTELERLTLPLKKLHQEFPKSLPQLTVDDYFKLEKMFENKQLDVIISTRTMTEDLSTGLFIPVCQMNEFAVMSPEVYAKLGYDSAAPEDNLTSSSQATFSKNDTCSWKNALCARECEFRLDTAEDYPLITLHQRLLPFRSGNKFQQDMMTYIHSHIHLACENDQAALLLAKSGYGVAILPEFYLPKQMDDLKILPVAGTKPMDYGFTIQEKSKAVEFLIQEYKNNLLWEK